MKKKKLLLLAVPLMLLWLLSGCHATFGIVATARNLPDGTSPAFLLPEALIPHDAFADPLSESVSVRCTYRENGWAAAAYYRSVYEVTVNAAVESNTVKLVYVDSSKEGAIALCEQFPVVRLAAVDKDGNTVAVSDDITLFTEGNLYTVRDFTYDFSTGQTEITEIYRRKWNGSTVDEWFFYSVIGALFGGVIALIAIIVNALVNKKESRRVIEWVILCVDAAPFAAMSAIYFVMHFHPALTPHPRQFGSTDVSNLLFCNMLWLLTAAGVCIHQYHTRNENLQPQEERKFV